MALGKQVRPVVFASEPALVEQFAQRGEPLARIGREHDVAALPAHKIALCAHLDDGRPCGKGGRFAADEPDDDVRTLDRALRAAHPLPLHRVRALAQPRRVGEEEVDAADLDRSLVDVTRRPRDIGDDRRVIPEQRVEERALARVRLADNGDAHARFDLSARAVLRDERRKARAHFAEMRRDLRKGAFGEVLLGIVKVCVDLGKAGGEPRLQLLPDGGEALLIEREPRAHLRLRGGGDHLAQPLRRREREFTVQKGALRELAALRHARAQLQRAGKDTARDLGAAVAMQLDDVLARKRMGRAEIDAHPVVGKAARVDRPRIEHIGDELPFAGEHFFCKRERALPAHADNGNAADAARRGDRRNEIVHDFL